MQCYPEIIHMDLISIVLLELDYQYFSYLRGLPSHILYGWFTSNVAVDQIKSPCKYTNFVILYQATKQLNKPPVFIVHQMYCTKYRYYWDKSSLGLGGQVKL